MKHDTSQEKLYQQFLDELQPGAEEYDRMMQMGKNPAALHRPRRTILRYAAAACLLLAATALALSCTSTTTYRQGSHQNPIATLP